MAGETDLTILLQSMNPILQDGEYVFCSIEHQDLDWTALEPIGFFREEEGMTLILRREQAEQAGLSYQSVFCMITLSVHSSLEAVGFIAAIATKLTEKGISTNPVSGYYHDHLFIPIARSIEAVELLQELANGKHLSDGLP